MTALETDYLIVGSGAVGLAFADTLIDESDADVIIVDRHGKPGGHWNDAYSFVALHQPSAFYGVNSTPLGTNRKDAIGVNTGLYELASGPEVSGYFDSVMRQKLLPSGRVRYFPMSDYRGDGRFVSLLSGQETQVTARRKTVDATYYGTTVPSTHSPRYSVSDDVRLVTPNALPQLWMDQTIKKSGECPRHFVIIGAGKTAMDAAVWLLSSGADPQAISWVMPRDSWLLNRLRTQPGLEFFEETIGGQAALMESFAQAESLDDLFSRLEAADVMLRIYPDVKPSMFHYATISKGEIETLRCITNVIRMGRVKSIDASGLTLDEGHAPMGEGTLYIDCTASAVDPRPAIPIFNGNLITPQLVRVPQPAFSAALVAFVEVHYPDDQAKNQLCRTVPFPHSLAHYPACNLANMMNQMAWMQDPRVSKWINQSRLDGFGKVIAAIDKGDETKMAILNRLRGNAMAAVANLQTLMA
ncbi:MAG: NAD(P)-binding protein [Sphingomonadaceae bacterium]